MLVKRNNPEQAKRVMLTALNNDTINIIEMHTYF